MGDSISELCKFAVSGTSDESSRVGSEEAVGVSVASWVEAASVLEGNALATVGAEAIAARLSSLSREGFAESTTSDLGVSRVEVAMVSETTDELSSSFF